jgi:cystathionine beta-lyase family protein involved in aluminum resistance
MLKSRKMVAMLIAAALMGVQLVVGGVVVALGNATFAEYVEMSKAAMVGLGIVTGTLIAAIGGEDAAAKLRGNPPEPWKGDEH